MLVVTYHSISNGPAPLCVTAERFAEQLDFLCGLGLEALPLRDLVAQLRAGETPPPRAFSITFDDGYRDFRESALPVLEARKLPATLFAVAFEEDSAVVPGGTGGPALRAEELREVVARGVEIGGHSASHRDLTRLNDVELERELADGRRILEERTGSRVESFAYPFGRFDSRVRAAVRAHFESAFTTQLAAVPSGIDGFAIPRVDAFYLDSAALRSAIAAGHPERYLTPRRWLRRLRGSEPRRSVVG